MTQIAHDEYVWDEGQRRWVLDKRGELRPHTEDAPRSERSESRNSNGPTKILRSGAIQRLLEG